MAALGSQTIASSFEQLLHVDTDGGGDTSTLVPVKDGDNGTTFCISMTDASTGKAVLAVDGSHANGTEVQIDNSATDGDAFLSFQLSGTSVFTMGVDDGDSDKFKIGTTAIGTGTMVTLDSDSIISLSTGDAGTSNTLFGKNTGDGIASGGNYNVCIGEEAGGALSTGVNNVAVGYNSLYRATTESDDNVVIGYNAMSGNFTTAVVNDVVAIGSGALAGTLTADATGTTVVGTAAGAAITSGQKNTGVGFGALTAETDGDFSVAVGYNALAASTGGAGTMGSTAVGYSAGSAITSGAGNTLIGYLAGDALDTMTHNTAVGYGALGGSSAVDNTVVIGSGAGAGAMTAAADNTVLIGYRAGAAITSGASNIAIGPNCMLVHTTGDNNIAIGENAMNNNDAGSTSLGSNNNIFMGINSGAGAWTDAVVSHNVGIGHLTLSGAMDNAIRNVAVGYNSFVGVTTGDNNVGVGTSAGASCVGGGLNVCIGSSADVNAAGVSNAVAIGYGAVSIEDEITLGRGDSHIYTQNDNASWTASSDERKKKNIQDVSLGLDFVNDLRTVTFQYRPAEERPEEWGHFHYDKDEDGNDIGEKLYSKTDTETVHHGMIAQEVKAALDTAGVNGENFEGWKAGKNGEQGIAPSAFVYPLIKAVQELSAKVTALEDA